MNVSYQRTAVNSFLLLLCVLCLVPSAQVGLTPSSSQPVSFVAPLDVEVGDQPGSIAIADFNGDGVQDLAVVISTAPPAASRGVAIMLARATEDLDHLK